MKLDWPGLTNESDPDFHDPRYQRRVLAKRRPIWLIENVEEATLECGHEPLLLGDNRPEVGQMCFCGDCRDEAKAGAA